MVGWSDSPAHFAAPLFTQHGTKGGNTFWPSCRAARGKKRIGTCRRTCRDWSWSCSCCLWCHTSQRWYDIFLKISFKSLFEINGTNAGVLTLTMFFFVSCHFPALWHEQHHLNHCCDRFKAWHMSKTATKFVKVRSTVLPTFMLWTKEQQNLWVY